MNTPNVWRSKGERKIVYIECETWIEARNAWIDKGGELEAFSKTGFCAVVGMTAYFFIVKGAQ